MQETQEITEENAITIVTENQMQRMNTNNTLEIAEQLEETE